MRPVFYEFDRFCVDPVRRELWKDGKPVQIKAKPFDLLLVFVETPDKAISKEELMRRVWPQNRVVTDNTFSVTLTHVRKALGDSAQTRRYIIKVPQGYRFVANVRETREKSGNRPHQSPGSLELSQKDTASMNSGQVGNEKTSSSLSTKMNRLFSEDWGHVLLAGGLYAALYAVGVLVEVAYQFDQYGKAAILFSMATAVWIFTNAIAGLAIDRRLTLSGNSHGFAVSVNIFLVSAAALYAASCFFLPAEPITELTVQAYTAQAAYLKTIAYFIFLMFVFLLVPFHFVSVMQRELQNGRRRQVLGLLMGERMSIAPRRVIYLRFWLLLLAFALVFSIALFLHHSLMSKLRPGPHMNLFSNLILARLIIYYALAGECVIWYYRSLNELKRECLQVESAPFVD